MSKTTPCLWFDRQAEEAATFYTSLFPNSRITETSYYPEGGELPAGTALTVAFELDGRAFTALNGGPDFHFTEAVSFQISCEDQDEVDHYWYACPRAARRARAGGSRTGSGCPGRSSRPRCRGCSATPIPNARSARWPR
jgi:predicted 3-demethylubiquinone-9 3-methyltransferase (glyoxalase superfamily)